MQLFILGPAFGLPSIDAECNAAVALLQLRVKNGYTLTPTHHTNKRLPQLVDGQAQASGFINIVRYLVSKRISSDDANLSISQSTDSLAITSLIESHAQILLDISLYVAYENYRIATRPAFTKILPWHVNYIIPPQRRTAARTRTEHLGVSSIDVDNVHEDMSNRPTGMDGVGKDPGFEAEAQTRASLLLPRKETLKSLLQRPQHAAVFKLHALADNFFGPLEDLLGKQSFLMGTENPSSVDCLLYGYMSLMLYPQLPQDWLESTLRRKYKTLAAYTTRIHSLLGLATNIDAVLDPPKSRSHDEDVSRPKKSNMSLPWSAPTSSTASLTLKEIANGIWEQLPVTGTSNQLHVLDAKGFSFFDRNLPTLLLSTAATFAAMGYLAVRNGFFIWPHGDEIHIFGQKRLSDYGHLGAALSGVSLLGHQPR